MDALILIGDVEEAPSIGDPLHARRVQDRTEPPVRPGRLSTDAPEPPDEHVYQLHEQVYQANEQLEDDP